MLPANYTNRGFNPWIANGLRALAIAAVAGLAVHTGTADAKGIPAENLTANPSFQEDTSGWDGFQAEVSQIKIRKAPAGRKAARVRAAAGVSTYTVDDAPATVHNAAVQGATYTAGAYAKGTRTSRRQMVGLVVREMTPNGEFVADAEEQVKLRLRRFSRVEVSYEAHGDGNVIDVYVRRPETIGEESFLVDAVTLTSSEATEEPPVEEPPVEEPPVEEPPEEPPVESSVTTSQVAIITSQEDALFADDDSSYRYIIIRDSLHNRLEELREAHPEAEILLYKDIAFTLHEPGCPYDPFQGGGLSYCEANDGHENWFLHTAGGGNRLASESYPAQRAMNVANAGYRRAWADTVLERLGDAHNDGSNAEYDGIFIDDANLYPGHGMDGNIAELTDAEYRQAMVGMVDLVSNEIRDAGFTSAANVGMDPWDPAHRSATMQVARDVDVINREGFVHWGEAGTLFTDPDGAAPFWEDEVKLAEDVQAAGAAFNGMVYGTAGDTQTQRYSRATFLMAWDGESASSIGYRVTAASNPWLPDWTTDIGTPTEDRRQVGQGWRRDYSGGTVIINARGSGSQNFSLGGNYRAPDGSCPGSLALGASKALILASC